MNKDVLHDAPKGNTSMYKYTQNHDHCTSSDSLRVTCTLECGDLGIVINEVLDPLVRVPHLPAEGQGELVGHGAPWVLPLGRLAAVVHKVDTTVWKHSLL